MKLRAFLLAGLLATRFVVADTVFVSNLYEPLYDSAAIETFDPAGNRSLFAATGPTAPNGLTFDAQGNLYVANYGNNTIMKYDVLGNGSVYANTGLNQPHVLALDPGGNLFVANDGGNAGYIQKITPNGQATLFASGLYQPQGIACDAFGNVFVSSWINNNTATAILKYDSVGNRTTFAITSSLGIPRGLAFNDGYLYAVLGRAVQRYAPNGARTVAANSGLTNPIGIAFDSDGNFYVTDQPAQTVMKYSPNGAGTVFASGINIPAYVAVQPVPVPEPSVLALVGLSLVVRLACRRHSCPSSPALRHST